ncbi:MAG TPA: LysM peptidoglycan-binding domain-containing protein [Anaerolineae bacterium]|nr:LysM peptidoglycan-binding domain-containing protein [Anaerolineae bacterium]
MTTPPELSPDLRPVRYCPKCGQRVAQRAEDCFMCGHDLRASQPRRLSLPVRDLIMILVVLGVAYLWWTRGGRGEEAVAQPLAATATVTATSTSTAIRTVSPTQPAPPALDIELTLPIVASPALTLTEPITVTTPLTPTATPTPIIYTVVSGDNVNKIAARYSISVRDLMAANDMSSDLLQVDQKLVIPAAGSAGAGEAASSEVAPAGPTATPVVYVVKRGDTVNIIAARYGISVQDLMAFNGMNSDLIQVDQKLTIPLGDVPRGPDGLPIPTPTPTPRSAIYLVVVRAGDTIETIAKRLGSSVEAIVNFNDHLQNADTIIRPGEQVIVPVGTITATLTIQSVSGPTATPVPMPTATPGPPHAAPQLLTPLDGAQVDEETVLLQWLSVGTLGPTEVYVVRVVPDGRGREEFTATTVGASLRIPSEWLQRQGQRTNRFLWSVQVARAVRTSTSEASGLLATSSPSRYRSFQWAPPAN